MSRAPITDMSEFRRVKKDLFAKYGDAIIMGSDEEREKILAELKVAAKFARMPAERLLTALARQYVEETAPPKPHEERAREIPASIPLRCVP